MYRTCKNVFSMRGSTLQYYYVCQQQGCSMFDLRTAWRRAFLGPYTSSTARRAPGSYETRRFVTLFTVTSPEPHTCSLHPHILFLKNHFNIILPPMSCFSKWSVHSFRLIFFNVFLTCPLLHAHPLYASHPLNDRVSPTNVGYLFTEPVSTTVSRLN